MRVIAMIMAALLALSLTACTDNGNGTTNPDNNKTPGTTDNGNGNGGTNNGNTNNNGNGTNNDTDDNNLGAGSNNTNGNTNGGTSNGNNADKDNNTTTDTRRVMYNGDLYEVTDETLDSDEVGVELFSITNIVEDMPAEDGDAIGLDEGTKVYRLKDDNEYNEIAVEINNVFYKAVKQS